MDCGIRKVKSAQGTNLKRIYCIKILEIKLCGLGSRIRDMETKWRVKVITELISY
jgi:hypothetical protein